MSRCFLRLYQRCARACGSKVVYSFFSFRGAEAPLFHPSRLRRAVLCWGKPLESHPARLSPTGLHGRENEWNCLQAETYKTQRTSGLIAPPVAKTKRRGGPPAHERAALAQALAMLAATR